MRVLRPGALSHYYRLHQCRNSSTNAPSSARLAFEFHGLEIPASRKKLLSQQSDSAAANPQQIPSTTSRLDLTVEQRRAARLAREAVTGPKTNSTRADWRQKSSAAVRPKRVPNANRFQGLDALGQFTPLTSAKNAVKDRRRREPRKDASNASRRGRPGGRTTPGKRFAAVKSSSTVPQSGNVNETQEPSLESLEEGGEESMKAGLTVPENLSVDLSDILGRIRPTIGVVPALRRNSAPGFSPVKDRTQYIMEAVGGDYARYSPHVTQDYLTNPKELGAIKQAHVTLSKNKGVDLNQRELLLRLVTTSTLSSNMKQIARA